VTAYSDDDGLHLIVYDSGIGMEQDVIDKMLDSKKPVEAQEDAASQMLSGFGLRGTIERVRYYCGRDDVVKIRSEVGEYTEIEFIIPVKEE